MNKFENTLWVSWRLTFAIGMALGALFGWVLAIDGVSSYTGRVARNSYAWRVPLVGSVYRAWHWVAYEPTAIAERWYVDASNNEALRGCHYVYQEEKGLVCEKEPCPCVPVITQHSLSRVAGWMAMYWAVLIGVLGIATHAYRLHRDQSILDQLWH